MSTFITGKKFSSIIDIKKVLEAYDGEHGSIDFFRFHNGEKFELDGTVGFIEVQFKGQDAKELLAFGTEEGRALPISYFHKRIKLNSDNEEIKNVVFSDDEAITTTKLFDALLQETADGKTLKGLKVVTNVKYYNAVRSNGHVGQNSYVCFALIK